MCFLLFFIRNNCRCSIRVYGLYLNEIEKINVFPVASCGYISPKYLRACYNIKFISIRTTLELLHCRYFRQYVIRDFENAIIGFAIIEVDRVIFRVISCHFNTVELFFVSFRQIFRKCAVHCSSASVLVSTSLYVRSNVLPVGDIFYPCRHHDVCYTWLQQLCNEMVSRQDIRLLRQILVICINAFWCLRA
jgi:hypothetical protein